MKFHALLHVEKSSARRRHFPRTRPKTSKLNKSQDINYIPSNIGHVSDSQWEKAEGRHRGLDESGSLVGSWVSAYLTIREC